MAYLDEIERRCEACKGACAVDVRIEGADTRPLVEYIGKGPDDGLWAVSMLRRAEELFAIYMPRQTDSEAMKWSADLERGPAGGGGVE